MPGFDHLTRSGMCRDEEAILTNAVDDAGGDFRRLHAGCRVGRGCRIEIWAAELAPMLGRGQIEL